MNIGHSFVFGGVNSSVSSDNFPKVLKTEDLGKTTRSLIFQRGKKNTTRFYPTPFYCINGWCMTSPSRVAFFLKIINGCLAAGTLKKLSLRRGTSQCCSGGCLAIWVRKDCGFSQGMISSVLVWILSFCSPFLR